MQVGRFLVPLTSMRTDAATHDQMFHLVPLFSRQDASMSGLLAFLCLLCRSLHMANRTTFLKLQHGPSL